MGLNKYFRSFLIIFLSGCATISPDQKKLYEQGYRAGLKEEIAKIAAQFQGGQFPYYHWGAPIVQDVAVPAHIEHGAFVPAHNELVLIKPGEWVKSPAYPITTTTQENTDHEYKTNTDITGSTDITFVPTSARQ